MKNADRILKENPLLIGDMMKKGAAKRVKYLIWLGQVEVINYLAVNNAEKLELLKEIEI